MYTYTSMFMQTHIHTHRANVTVDKTLLGYVKSGKNLLCSPVRWLLWPSFSFLLCEGRRCFYSMTCISMWLPYRVTLNSVSRSLLFGGSHVLWSHTLLRREFLSRPWTRSKSFYRATRTWTAWSFWPSVTQRTTLLRTRKRQLCVRLAHSWRGK